MNLYAVITNLYEGISLYGEPLTYKGKTVYFRNWNDNNILYLRDIKIKGGKKDEKFVVKGLLVVIQTSAAQSSFDAILFLYLPEPRSLLAKPI